MRIYADVYDSAGTTRQGDGPVQITNVSVTRALDGAGRVTCSAFGGDIRARTLFITRRRIRFYYEYQGTTREIGRGIIEDMTESGDGANLTIQVTGSDEILGLKDKSTLLARTYTGASLASVLTALTALSGWTVTTSIVQNVDIRFDGETVLKGIQTLCENNGLHFRQGVTANSIEVGTFGTNNGVRFWHVEHAESSIYDTDDLVVVDTATIMKAGKEIVNWLLPIGAGEGEAALTLEKSTRTSPYTIQTMTGPDGRTLYYISDSVSIATYGQIQRVVPIKEIAPISNTDADIVAAANALYDATAAYLTRHKNYVETYSLSGRKPQQTIRSGDKIHLTYKGRMINEDGQEVVYRNIDTDLWVLEITESVSESGALVSLQVSTVDRYEEEAAGIIIGVLDEIEINNLKVQPYPSSRSYVYAREMASGGFNADIPIRFSDSTLTLQRVQVRVKTMPFRATASVAGAGGDHRHKVAYRSSSDDVTGPNFGTNRGYRIATDIGGGGTGTVNFTNGPDSDLYTIDGSGTHTHSLTFGITDDSQTPTSISVYVDGIDRTSALGGPFAPSGGNVTIDLNTALLTGYLINAAGGLRQEHTVQLRCASGRGRIEAQVEIAETVQSVKLS